MPTYQLRTYVSEEKSNFAKRSLEGLNLPSKILKAIVILRSDLGTF